MNDFANATFPTISSSSSLMRYPNSFFHQESLIHNEVIPVPLSQLSMQMESSNIIPTSSTVVIGKGRVPKKAPGNRKLRSLVQDKVQDYVNAKSKMVKSSIVTDIYFAIEELCRQEGSAPPFVRYNGTGYSKTTESIAREKITSCFRDCLHDRYKSSSKNKVAKRRLANKEKAEKKRMKRIEDQQLEFLRREMLPMPMPILESSMAIHGIQKRLVADDSQHQHQRETQHDGRAKPQIQTSGDNLIHNTPSYTFLNQLQPKISRIGTFSTPLFEFVTTPVDRSFFEKVPVPVPDMDCASTCSSSSSYSSKCTGGIDGY